MAGRKTTRDSGGGRKSQIVTIRLDPRLKYLAELAARRQRRPLSSYIEWAIEESLRQVQPQYNPGLNEEQTLADEASSLWDVDEADRLANLALRYPELLTHDEQVIWKLIRENGFLWRGQFAGPNGEWQWGTTELSLNRDRLRAYWETFKEVAAGDLPEAKLPEWPRTKGDKTGAGPALFLAEPDEVDDEIPF